ncbi:unnamed protein product, partial [Scytosiphon promiscuus]
HSYDRFGGNEGHDPHVLYTLSALQAMALLGELERVDKDKVRRPPQNLIGNQLHYIYN